MSSFSPSQAGAARTSAAELDRLLGKYGVPAEGAERMRAQCKEARKRGVAGRVPDWARTYVELEQGADEIKPYDGQMVSGLLQTDEYARALLATSLIAPPEDALNGRPNVSGANSALLARMHLSFGSP